MNKELVKEFDDNNADQEFEKVIVADKQKECDAITGRCQSA
jgi:hypothetical protein